MHSMNSHRSREKTPTRSKGRRVVRSLSLDSLRDKNIRHGHTETDTRTAWEYDINKNSTTDDLGNSPKRTSPKETPPSDWRGIWWSDRGKGDMTGKDDDWEEDRMLQCKRVEGTCVDCDNTSDNDKPPIDTIIDMPREKEETEALYSFQHKCFNKNLTFNQLMQMTPHDRQEYYLEKEREKIAKEFELSEIYTFQDYKSFLKRESPFCTCKWMRDPWLRSSYERGREVSKTKPTTVVQKMRIYDEYRRFRDMQMKEMNRSQRKYTDNSTGNETYQKKKQQGHGCEHEIHHENDRHYTNTIRDTRKYTREYLHKPNAAYRSQKQHAGVAYQPWTSSLRHQKPATPCTGNLQSHRKTVPPMMSKATNQKVGPPTLNSAVENMLNGACGEAVGLLKNLASENTRQHSIYNHYQGDCNSKSTKRYQCDIPKHYGGEESLEERLGICENNGLIICTRCREKFGAGKGVVSPDRRYKTKPAWMNDLEKHTYFKLENYGSWADEMLTRRRKEKKKSRQRSTFK